MPLDGNEKEHDPSGSSPSAPIHDGRDILGCGFFGALISFGDAAQAVCGQQGWATLLPVAAGIVFSTVAALGLGEWIMSRRLQSQRRIRDHWSLG
jgi:hypothetical protein